LALIEIGRSIVPRLETRYKSQPSQKPAYVWLILIVFLALCLWPLCRAKAEETGDHREPGQPLKESEETIEEEGDEPSEGSILPESLRKRLRLNAFVEINYEYADVSDVGDKDNGSSSDFFIATAGLGLEFFFDTQSSARIAIEEEDVGRRGGNGKVTLDEATLSLRPLRPPLYLIMGKRQLPFGVFENHLIDGPLTEDLYEINEIGGTVGLTLDFWRLNVSCSIYKDTTIPNNLEDFHTFEPRPGSNHEGAFQSYIANVTFVPLPGKLFLSAFYDSEPGRGSRNQTLGGAITLASWDLKLDVEYIAALSREKDEEEQEAKECVWVIGLAYDLLDTVELAARYETFDDGRTGDQDEVIKYRILGGLNLSFWDFATLSFQYSFSRFEKEKDSNASDAENLFQVQLTLEI
jgi:hypothetical protein